MTRSKYALNVSSAARRDLRSIARWSLKEFGETAAQRYRDLLDCALNDIASDPHRPGVRAHSNLPGGTLIYHLSLSRERARSDLGTVKTPRHALVYRVSGQVVELLRVIHDSRDLVQHLETR